MVHRGGGIGRIEPGSKSSEDFLLPPVKTAVEESEPPPNTSLGGITTGPEHENLWFTEVENGSSKIDHINPTSHAIAEFTLPPQNELGGGAGGTRIENIAAGPKETLWFAEPGSHAIGVVNTEGTLLDQIALKEADDPQSIAAGPEGNMWFTDSNAPYVIGRVNPAGEVSEFPAPSAPASIVAGPDGNMWFTQGGLSDEAGVGCIVPTGQIELIRERTEGGDPVGITVNTDGTIWFTQSQSDKLDHLYPVVCGAKPPPPPTTTNGSNSPLHPAEQRTRYNANRQSRARQTVATAPAPGHRPGATPGPAMRQQTHAAGARTRPTRPAIAQREALAERKGAARGELHQGQEQQGSPHPGRSSGAAQGHLHADDRRGDQG